jgi:ABC-type uncharacterized transport system involved in gliding motility auxiliary subunit
MNGIINSIWGSIKDSFIWVLGGDPYKESVLLHSNMPDEQKNARIRSSINWTRVFIVLGIVLFVGTFLKPYIVLVFKFIGNLFKRK